SASRIVVVLIPLLVLIFLRTHRHYQRVERERVTDIPIHPKDIHHRLIVPIAGLDRAAIQSLAYARSISSHVTAVHIAGDMNHANNVRDRWQEWQMHLTDGGETHRIIMESQYRSLRRTVRA